MHALRRLFATLLIAVMAASAVMLPAAAMAAVAHNAKAMASDCHCPKADCAKNAACASNVCVNVCANWVAASLPAESWTPVFTKTDVSAAVETDRTALDRPPPLPPPRA